MRKDDTDVCVLYMFFTFGKLIFEFFSLVNKTQQPFTQLIPLNNSENYIRRWHVQHFLFSSAKFSSR